MGTVNDQAIREACYLLGYREPISIEPDGIVWLGENDNREYPPMEPINEKTNEVIAAKALTKKQAEQKLLELGLTVADLRVLGL